MKVICAWCGKELGEALPFTSDRPTHTKCIACRIRTDGGSRALFESSVEFRDRASGDVIEKIDGIETIEQVLPQYQRIEATWGRPIAFRIQQRRKPSAEPLTA